MRMPSGARNPLLGSAVERSQINTIGHDLQRPECILAQRDGTLWSADAREQWLYVVESNGRRISSLRAHRDGLPSDREIVGPADLGATPDGVAFDAFGNLWITIVQTDRLVALTPGGERWTLIDDCDAKVTAQYDRHFYAGTMTAEIMAAPQGSIALWMASLTFGGPCISAACGGPRFLTSRPR